MVRCGVVRNSVRTSRGSVFQIVTTGLRSNSMKSDENRPKLALILGVTASGKSDCALAVADALNGEIVSVDSMQVYRGMDIGTAKPTVEERARVPHHLIDILEPSEACSAAFFAAEADKAIAEIAARGRLPIVVGGTPLYLMSLMFGMFEGPSADPELRRQLRAVADEEGTATLHRRLEKVDPNGAERIHPNDYKRIERALEVYELTGKPLSELQTQWSADGLRYPGCVIGLRREKEDASRRINARVKLMVEMGLVEEVRGLLERPNGLSEQARQGLGYAQIIDHLEGRMSLADAVEQIKILTRRFAKHQRTWYRKFHMAQWVDIGAEESKASIAERVVGLLT